MEELREEEEVVERRSNGNIQEISKNRSEMSICSICRPTIAVRLADQRHVVALFDPMHSIMTLHSNASYPGRRAEIAHNLTWRLRQRRKSEGHVETSGISWLQISPKSLNVST